MFLLARTPKKEFDLHRAFFKTFFWVCSVQDLEHMKQFIFVNCGWRYESEYDRRSWINNSSINSAVTVNSFAISLSSALVRIRLRNFFISLKGLLSSKCFACFAELVSTQSSCGVECKCDLLTTEFRKWWSCYDVICMCSLRTSSWNFELLLFLERRNLGEETGLPYEKPS